MSGDRSILASVKNEKDLIYLAERLHTELGHVLRKDRNCTYCESWNAKDELCTLFAARPPVSVIVRGCDSFADDIPF